MSVSQPTLPTFGIPPAVPPNLIWRLNVEQYHQMIRSGILTKDHPVELLEGLLVTKMPKNPQHRAATKLVQQALEAVVPAGCYVDSQEPVTMASSEPEPDVVVVRGNTRDYLNRHPGPQDLLLVVEVSDTTLDYDRTVKKSIYANAALPAYWIVNISDQQVEVYTDPTGHSPQPDYRQRQDYGRSATLPLFIDGAEVARLAVRDLLP